MTINVTSGSSGWGNYVLYGTKEKPRDNDKVEFLEGDIALGDRLSESNNYQESYYKIVLAFEGKPSDEVIKGAYEDFKKEMFVGFKPDEYHIDAVIHKDTDNYHIHCRVPKQNLKTDTHLQLYLDKIDRPRKQLIQDHISLKYGFAIARETNREVFKEQSHEHINKWREQHNQKPFDFSNKKGQAEAETQINGYLSELIKSGLIEKREDVITTLKELGLKIEKENGLDIKKDFAYTTVSNETGKMRVKGEIHHDRFYEHSREDRTAQIDNNQRITAEREPNQERAERVRAELNRANEKRFNKVTKLFKHSRERAEREHSKTIEVGELESINTSKSVKHNNRSIDRNTNNSRAEARAKTNDVSKRDIKGQVRESLYPIQSARINVRQNPTNVLLSNQIKERANERYYREAIERITREREASAEALRRVKNEREALQRGIERDNKELQNGVIKIANYYEQIRNKVVNTINEVKESFKDRLSRIEAKFKAKAKAPVTGADNSLYELENDFDFEKMSKDAKTTQKAVLGEKVKTTSENDSSLLTNKIDRSKLQEKLDQIKETQTKENENLPKKQKSRGGREGR